MKKDQKLLLKRDHASSKEVDSCLEMKTEMVFIHISRIMYPSKIFRYRVRSIQQNLSRVDF